MTLAVIFLRDIRGAFYEKLTRLVRDNAHRSFGITRATIFSMFVCVPRRSYTGNDPQS
jgi:hypothetical protein